MEGAEPVSACRGGREGGVGQDGGGWRVGGMMEAGWFDREGGVGRSSFGGVDPACTVQQAQGDK